MIDRCMPIGPGGGCPLGIGNRDHCQLRILTQHRLQFWQINFWAEIRPLPANPLIEYLGEITDADKNEFLGNARALLCPYDWPEPFGLVLIEALACGTP